MSRGRDIKILLKDFLFQIENTVNVLRQTLLQCLATFLVYFVCTFAIGLGVVLTIKLFAIFFS